MTDNEIIKALECCARLNRKCNECPLLNDGAVSEHCVSVIRCEALDLIKRQRAKIEELSEVLSDHIRMEYAKIRAEAITEFAERLKSEAVEARCCTFLTVVCVSDINSILAEMTEGDNGE